MRYWAGQEVPARAGRVTKDNPQSKVADVMSFMILFIKGTLFSSLFMKFHVDMTNNS